MSNNLMMSRLRGNTVKYIAVVIFGFIGVYVLFSYHDISTQLKISEEKLSRVSQQHDSVSAQLQVVYEHKSKLEKRIEQERLDHKKTKEEMKEKLTQMDIENQSDKSKLLGRIESINQESKLYQGHLEDQQFSYQKLQEELDQKTKYCDIELEEQNDKLALFKQEKENDIMALNDVVANLKRDLQYKQQLLEQNQELLNQNQQLQQQQPVQQQQQLPVQQQQQQQLVNQPILQNQVGQPNLYQQPQQLPQGNEFQRLQSLRQQIGQLEQYKLQQSPGAQPNNAFPAQQQQKFDLNNNNKGQSNVAQAQPVGNQQPQQNQQNMQINKPDKPGYYKPKLPEYVAHVGGNAAADDNAQEDVRAGQVVNEQVLPPKHDEVEPAKQDDDAVEAAKEPGDKFDFALRHRRDMVYEEEDEDDKADDADYADDHDDDDGDDEPLAANADANDDDLADGMLVDKAEQAQMAVPDVNHEDGGDARDDGNDEQEGYEAEDEKKNDLFAEDPNEANNNDDDEQFNNRFEMQ